MMMMMIIIMIWFWPETMCQNKILIKISDHVDTIRKQLTWLIVILLIERYLVTCAYILYPHRVTFHFCSHNIILSVVVLFNRR